MRNNQRISTNRAKVGLAAKALAWLLSITWLMLIGSNARAGTLTFTPGIVKWDVYRDIGSGNSVDDLTNDPKYPDSPDETRLLSSYEQPVNIYEAFGSRQSGLFIPPSNGNYVFFMHTDDNGALFLSTDDKPANKKQIAAETV